MHSRAVRFATRFGLVATLFALSACDFSCSFGGNLDTEKLEKGIADELEKKTGVAPDKIECPEDVKEEEGETFTCTATAPDGSKAIITVTMKGDGNVNWEVTSTE